MSVNLNRDPAYTLGQYTDKSTVDIKPEQVKNLVKLSVDDAIDDQKTSRFSFNLFSNENTHPTNQVKIANVANFLNDRIKEFDADLSAEVIKLGGQKFIEIKNEESGAIIRRISDEKLLDYISQREKHTGLLIDTQI